MSEKTIDEEEIRREHEMEVRPAMQWTYLVGALTGGTLLMLVLIALMGGSGS